MTTELFAGETAALTGLAALETVADLEVFLTEGKAQSYLASGEAVIPHPEWSDEPRIATDFHRSEESKSQRIWISFRSVFIRVIRGERFFPYFSESAATLAHCAS